jgi:hypothetical protein
MFVFVSSFSDFDFVFVFKCKSENEKGSILITSDRFHPRGCSGVFSWHIQPLYGGVVVLILGASS